MAQEEGTVNGHAVIWGWTHGALWCDIVSRDRLVSEFINYNDSDDCAVDSVEFDDRTVSREEFRESPEVRAEEERRWAAYVADDPRRIEGGRRIEVKHPVKGWLMTTDGVLAGDKLAARVAAWSETVGADRVRVIAVAS